MLWNVRIEQDRRQPFSIFNPIFPVDRRFRKFDDISPLIPD